MAIDPTVRGPCGLGAHTVSVDLSRFDAAPLIAFTACMDAPIGASDI